MTLVYSSTSQFYVCVHICRLFQVLSLIGTNPVGQEMPPHSGITAWETPLLEEPTSRPVGLQSQRRLSVRRHTALYAQAQALSAGPCALHSRLPLALALHAC